LLGRLSSQRVAVAPRAARYLTSIGIRATHVFNPIRLETERSPRAGDDLRILFVGTYGERKGSFELVDAIALLRSRGLGLALRFVGKEEYAGEEKRLRRRVGERGLGDVVEFFGVAGAGALARVYADADVFCLPARREALPMALLEAMGSGLPVVVTPVGAIADVVEDGISGLLVTPGDVDSLADAIAALSADPDLRARLGEAARRRVRELAGAEAVADAWHRIYDANADPKPVGRLEEERLPA
jgi:glycosyltransferase involved in cell wall biosynthesis